jgi:hypothetical protein
MRDRRKIPKRSYSQKMPRKSEKNALVVRKARKTEARTRFSSLESQSKSRKDSTQRKLLRLDSKESNFSSCCGFCGLGQIGYGDSRNPFLEEEKSDRDDVQQSALDHGDRKVGFCIFISLPQQQYIGQHPGKEESRAH